jgi:hypothetical protein
MVRARIGDILGASFNGCSAWLCRLCADRPYRSRCIRNIWHFARTPVFRDSDDWSAAAFYPGRRDALAVRAHSLADIPRRAMRRSHRIVHRMVWPVLTLAVVVIFALALFLRAPPPS